MKRFLFAIIVFVSLQSFAQFRVINTRSGAGASTSFGAVCSNYTATTSTSCILTGVQSTSTIVVGCAGGIGTCSVSDGTSYTYTSPSPIGIGVNAAYIFYRTNVAASTYTVTATTADGASDSGLWAVEIKGANTSNPIGLTNCATGSGTVINTPTITGVSASSAIFAIATEAANISSATAPYTAIGAPLNGNLAEYQVNVASGNYSASFSTASGQWWSCILEIDTAVNPASDGDMLLALGSTTSGNVTTTNLQTDTKCGNSAWGGSLITGAAMTYNNVITPTPPSLLRSFYTCGVANAGSGGVTIKLDNTDQNAGDAYAYTIALMNSATAKLSAGFWYMTDAANTAVSSSTTVNLNIQSASGPGDSACSLGRTGTGQLTLDLETVNGGTTVHSSTFNISRLTWYWISIQHVPGGLGSLKIYDSSGTLLTTLTAAQNLPATKSNGINFGPRAGAGDATIGNVYMHNIVLNYVNGNHIPPQ